MQIAKDDAPLLSFTVIQRGEKTTEVYPVVSLAIRVFFPLLVSRSVVLSQQGGAALTLFVGP